MAARTLFVTGTDTGIGKTHVASALVAALAARGARVAGFKPVASGAARTPAGLRNEDAEALLAASNVPLDYADVNPFCFEPPIAPHLAAREAGVALSVAALVQAHARLAHRAEHVVVEGAGGWLVPLNDTESLADLAAALEARILLVVGIRLGCLNHALLTAEDIRRRGLPLAGWVANRIDPACLRADALVEDLAARLGAPLADLSWGPSPGAEFSGAALGNL